MGKWASPCLLLVIGGCHPGSVQRSAVTSPPATSWRETTGSIPQAERSALAVRAFELPVPRGDAQHLAALLTSLFPPDQSSASGVYGIETSPVGDVLHVRATEAAYARMLRMLRRGPCDPPSDERVIVFPLMHRDAAEVVPGARAVAGPRVRVIADTPTNSLVLSAPKDWDSIALEEWLEAHDR